MGIWEEHGVALESLFLESWAAWVRREQSPRGRAVGGEDRVIMSQSTVPADRGRYWIF